MGLPSPALPLPPPLYDQRYMVSLLNVFRLYFDFGDPEPELYNMCGINTYNTATVNLGLKSGEVALIDTTSNAVTVNLPAANTSIDYRFTVKRISAGAHNVTIQAVSGNVENGATLTLAAQYKAYTLKSDGTNYWVVGTV